MSAVITLMQVPHICVRSAPSSLAYLLCSLAEKRNYQEQHRDQEHGHSVTPPMPPQLHLRLHLSHRAVCTTFNIYNLENCLHAMKNNKRIERSRSSISDTTAFLWQWTIKSPFPADMHRILQSVHQVAS